jgi:hypothetical protein
MKTISTKAVIGPDRVLTVQLPADVTPGEHEVVVVLNGATADATPALGPPHNIAPIDPSFTYRREDIYGDDGR